METTYVVPTITDLMITIRAQIEKIWIKMAIIRILDIRRVQVDRPTTQAATLSS